MPPKVVILDFDGTLIESVGVKDAAFAELFSQYPQWRDEILPYHLENNATIRFEKFRHIVEDILAEEYTPEREAETCDRFAESVYAGLTGCEWVPGAIEALDRLGATAPLYLVSVSPPDELARVLEARGIADRLTGVYAHPWVKTDAFAEILKREGVTPDEAVFIGDTREDAAFAAAAGIPFVGRDSGKPIPDDVPVFADMRGVADHVLGTAAPVVAPATDAPAACPACGEPFAESARAAYPGAAAHELAPEAVATCASCGSGVAVPPMTDEALDALYHGGGYWDPKDAVALSPRMFPGHWALARARWEFVEDHLADRFRDTRVHVLDIGAGHGFFGFAAAASSKVHLARYWAAEADQALIASLEAAWAAHGGGSELRTSVEASDAQGEFELLVLSNILEHLTDPAGLLGFVRSKLAPRGLVFVDVPNRDQRYKPDVFPHLVFFSLDGLERLLDRTGYIALETAVFGRTPAKTPLGIEGRGPLDALIDRAYALRRITPAEFSAGFYDRYYGASLRGEDGTWLRAVACVQDVSDGGGTR